jgi:hypothetical protein
MFLLPTAFPSPIEGKGFIQGKFKYLGLGF